MRSSWTTWALAGLLLTVAGACSSTASAPPGSSSASGAGGASATGSTTTGTGAAGGTSAGGSAPIPVDLTCNLDAAYGACDETVALPTTVATVVDATDPAAVKGRCDFDGEGFLWDEDNHLRLPEDRAAYPVLLQVAADGFEGPCSYCDQLGSPLVTTYGVGFEVPYEAWALPGEERRFVRLHVNDPWKIVSGGCGEACAHTCVDPSEGYLEFTPTTCLTSYGAGFGVATSADEPPPAEVLIELVPDEAFSPCCPYRCE